MSLIQISILAVIQGLAELLPVSSSAHVIVAQKLMGLDPSAPEMTFLLVMLHTGTMFAVLIYFWPRWKALLFSGQNSANRHHFLKMIITATALTGVVGLSLKILIEKVIFEHFLGHSHGEIESLFKVLPMVAAALFSAGLLISWTGSRDTTHNERHLDTQGSALIGIIQGLCLPFRGFSRSGATISTGLFLGIPKMLSEEFSFALAVALTPPVIALELKRLLKFHLTRGNGAGFDLLPLLTPGLIGMVLSFTAGFLALKWLSKWLHEGRWRFFGYYCLGFSGLTLLLWQIGI